LIQRSPRSSVAFSIFPAHLPDKGWLVAHVAVVSAPARRNGVGVTGESIYPSLKPAEEVEGRVLMANQDRDARGGSQTDVVTKVRPKTQRPSLYKVLMLNDDFTPMEFVVSVLERFFGKDREDATRIMLQVHRQGVGVCGVYTYEIAETKVTQVIDFARQHQHPLQCTLEKDG
jgi:ATP-dependent Clp protease adaptor protein ClpS